MLKQSEFYCVGCRQVITVDNGTICVKSIKNRRSGSVPALQAKCDCGCKLTKFVKRDSIKSLTIKFKKCRSKKGTKRKSKSKRKSKARSSRRR